jgi:hypothetical protein
VDQNTRDATSDRRYGQSSGSLLPTTPEVMAAQGFSNFTTKDLAGNAGKAPSGGAPPTAAVGAAATAVPPPCGGTATVTPSPGTSTPSPNAGAAASTTAPLLASGIPKSTIPGLDFGLCAPTMKFEAGLNGRKVTEFTFQAIDPLVNKGQQEALNPNIITNRICDQLTNVCNANAAAKAACLAAKAQILSLNTRDASTANTWNTVLGFAGTNINPDNAPQPGLVGHT